MIPTKCSQVALVTSVVNSRYKCVCLKETLANGVYAICGYNTVSVVLIR